MCFFFHSDILLRIVVNIIKCVRNQQIAFAHTTFSHKYSYVVIKTIHNLFRNIYVHTKSADNNLTLIKNKAHTILTKLWITNEGNY